MSCQSRQPFAFLDLCAKCSSLTQRPNSSCCLSRFSSSSYVLWVPFAGFLQWSQLCFSLQNSVWTVCNVCSSFYSQSRFTFTVGIITGLWSAFCIFYLSLPFLPVLLSFVLVLWDRVSLYSLTWPWTCAPPSASGLLGLQLPLLVPGFVHVFNGSDVRIPIPVFRSKIELFCVGSLLWSIWSRE